MSPKLRLQAATPTRFELLVQSVTDYAIYMLDPTGVVTSWNAGAQRAKGYREDEIIGRHFSCFYTDEDRAVGLPARALKTAEDEGRFEAEGWRMRKDGSRFWANVVIDPVRDPGGDLIGFAKVTRDLTERRQSQIALEQAQQAFLQSQKMEAIGKLTGGIAHDFNNLLAAILGSLDIARRRIANGVDPGRFIDNAIQAAERGATLTQRMLAFARKQDLRLEAVDLPELVRGLSELLQRSIGSAVAVDTQFPLFLKRAWTDAGQLELALINLAVNARDAMPSGGRITISARHEAATDLCGLAEGDYVVLSVADDGEGMDEKILAVAMEPFFTTKGVGRGTGLGLSMVHGLAEQCGGRLVLRSVLGEGTVAELWFKVADPASQPASSDQPAEPPAAATRPLVILAVDDDRLVLTNTAAMLSELGHSVIQASSAREALALLDENPVDLIVADYAMPQMTGVELAEEARARRPELPALIVTGYVDVAETPPFNLPTLSKPFRENELAQAIYRIMDSPRSA
jgi:PAS domain S-box-containing protein